MSVSVEVPGRMIKALRSLMGKGSTRPVFVIGTGRSGTHWLGYSLADHPEVRATIEVAPIFMWSTRMALDPTLECRLFPLLVLAYRWQLFRSKPRLYVDKTHPNIWHAEKLKRAFPEAQFVAIERNPYATVASMMVHRRVSAWQKRWREFPLPNRFLGITEEIAQHYDEMPIASQCALRWLAHRRRMDELQTVLGADLLRISYEDFARSPAQTVAMLQKFLRLEQPIPVPDVKAASMDKWRTQLDADQIRQIQDATGVSPPAM